MALDATKYCEHPVYGLLIGSNGTVIGRRGRPLTQKVQRDGYAMVHVALGEKGKSRWCTVHRLVAQAHLSGAGEQVNHKDGNKKNNDVSNLEWCDRAYNNRHALERGLRSMCGHIGARGERNSHAKLTEKQVMEIRSLKYKYGDAPWKRYSISNSQFYAVRNGKYWKEINHGA